MAPVESVIIVQPTGEEDAPEVDSDCPTPVADENGPESPDPETQNPENYAFSHTLNPSACGSGDQSNETSPAATPNAQNDVTPNLSPITDSEIPLAKQGPRRLNRTPRQEPASRKTPSGR